MPKSSLASLAEGLVSANLMRIPVPSLTEAAWWAANTLVVLVHGDKDPKQWRIALVPAHANDDATKEWDLPRSDESPAVLAKGLGLGSAKLLRDPSSYSGGFTGKVTLVIDSEGVAARNGATLFPVREAAKKLGKGLAGAVDQALEFWQRGRGDLTADAYGEEPVDPKVIASVTKAYEELSDLRLQITKLLPEADFPRKSKQGRTAANLITALNSAEMHARSFLEAAGEDLT